MARRLKLSVAVGNQVYPGGATPPGNVAKLITNPDAWEGGADESGSADSEIPPKGGAGSGKDAWAAYAAQQDVEVDDDATRDDIVAALEAAGVPTE